MGVDKFKWEVKIKGGKFGRGFNTHLATTKAGAIRIGNRITKNRTSGTFTVRKLRKPIFA